MKKFILWAVILGMLIGLTGCGTKEAGAEKEYVFTDGKHLRNEQYGATFQTKFVEAEGVTPVSYTHLDVYKRQELGSCKLC